MRVFQAERVPRPPFSLTLQPLLDHGPIDLEIGAGQGLHAIDYAARHPDRTLIAIERTRTKFASFWRRHLNHGLTGNLLPLHADAVSVVSHLLPPGCIERIFLLYPNPYPKAKQANRRWHNSPFMAELKKRLTASGTLHLATNLKWYAREAEEQLTRQWGLTLLSTREIGSAFRPRTHFERKYLARGEACHDLIFALDPEATPAKLYT